MRQAQESSRPRRMAVAAALAVLTSSCSGATTNTPAGSSTTSTAPTIAVAEPSVSTFNVGLLEDITTDNFWAYLGDQPTDANGYVLGSSHRSLFTYAYPNVLHVPSLAVGEPEKPIAGQEGRWETEQRIRSGVRWSDGEELTVHDLVFTYGVVRDFGLGRDWGRFFPLYAPAAADDPNTPEDEAAPERDGVLDIEAVDDYTVRITFSRQPSLSVWQNGVGLAPFMPEHFWAEAVEEARGSDNPAGALFGLSGKGEPSAGPIIYQDREPGTSVHATTNTDDYFAGTEYTFYADGSFRQRNDRRGFDEVYYGSGEGDVTTRWISGPHATDVRYTIYPDQNAAVLALRAGRIDYILSSLGLQAGLKDQIVSADDLTLIANPSNGFRYLAFNLRKSPMKFKGFRRAIACVTDKEFMQTLLSGAALPAYSLVPSGNTFWTNPEAEQLCRGMSSEERFATAVDILRSEGFGWSIEPEWDPVNLEVKAGTGTGLTDPEGMLVAELELLAPGQDFDPLRATYAQWIAEWSSNLGIPVVANPTGFRNIIDRGFALGAGSLSWDMYILGWTFDDASLPTFYDSFFATYQDSAEGGFNSPGYANPRLDELAAQLLAATDFSTARAAARAMDSIVVEDLPYLVLFQAPIVEAYRTTLVFPFTESLGGLQNLAGLPGDVASGG